MTAMQQSLYLTASPYFFLTHRREDLGTGGRGGFFDKEGIIRDVVQSHLLQAFMWLAMEPPSSMSPEAIVKAKMDLLRCVPALGIPAGPRP